MDLTRFRTMVARLAEEIPDEYYDGIAAIEVSPAARSDPAQDGVYVMGECVPLESGDGPPLSRIELYHGSFRAVAEGDPSFDWREEAWETLWHEVRHHLEWRAGERRLEDYDWAAAQNEARVSGGIFDPVFYRWGERIGEGCFRVGDDTFLEIRVKRGAPTALWTWSGTRYAIPMPEAPLPVYAAVSGMDAQPPGEFVLVLRRAPKFTDFFRRRPPPTHIVQKVQRLA